MQRSRWIVAALAILGAVSVDRAWGQSGAMLCSGGSNEGGACNTAAECPGGVCVIAIGVCDGGEDDGFDCDCPGAQCGSEPACSAEPEFGTCSGGPFAGECCEVAFNCTGGQPCVGTQKVCSDGEFKGFFCLRDDHCCPGEQCTEACISSGRVCVGGFVDGLACVDDEDCPGGECESSEGPPPTPTATPVGAGCVGDCDEGGDVTVDELVSMVNIGLGALLSGCPEGDTNNDQQITVDEILLAVNNALEGCS